RVTELAPSRVELPNHKVDSEALRIISSDDEEYLPLTRGNYVDVYFKTPEDAGDARTVIVGMKGYYVTHVNTEGERSLDSLGKMTKFILDPTYAIRYTYPKYLRSHWNEENT
ncbi:MAG: hypothetical protein ABH834_01375, partial [Candidatus Altiarchaeota archaeon]